MIHEIENVPRLSYVLIIIAADVLPTYRAKASEATVLMYLTRNIGDGAASGKFSRLM